MNSIKLETKQHDYINGLEMNDKMINLPSQITSLISETKKLKHKHKKTKLKSSKIIVTFFTPLGSTSTRPIPQTCKPMILHIHTAYITYLK